MEYSEFFEKLDKKKQIKHKILVSINNTSDKTEEVVKNHMKKHKSVNYINLVKGGKGYAVIEGFKKAIAEKSDYIGFVDADMATIPEEYYKLIEKLKNYDVGIAERYSKGAKIIPKITFSRFLAKKLFNFVVRAVMFLPFRDTQCGAKVFRRQVLEKIMPSLSMSQWAFDVEILYHVHKNNFLTSTVPTKWFDKEGAKINFWTAGPVMVLGIIRLRLLNSPFKGIVRLYDFTTSKLTKGKK